MVTLEELVPSDHIYRKFKELWDFSEIEKEMNKMESNSTHKGYGLLGYFYVSWFNLWRT